MRIVTLLLGLVLLSGCGFEGEASNADYVQEVKDAIEKMEVATEENIADIKEKDITLITASALLVGLEAEEALERIKNDPSSRYKDLDSELKTYLRDTSEVCKELSQNPTDELKTDCATLFDLTIETKEKIVKLYEKE